MASAETSGKKPGLWVDPREYPDPPLRVPPRPPAPDASGIAELVRLCREGHLYAVEKWIRDGKPLHALDYRTSGSHYLQTPLRIAIETRQHDLARLLLANGYKPEEGLGGSLDHALYLRARDLVELLLAWGADPKQVDHESILDSYDSTLIERFWKYGFDYAEGHYLADYLSSRTKNRPAYGWARKHRDDPAIARELAIALGEAIWHDREGPVCLLVWAGADPHMKVPSLMYPQPEEEDEEDWSSAIERAVSNGRGRFLARLGPDPKRDDLDTLWATVRDPEAVDVLAGIRLPLNWSPMIRRNIYWMTLGFGEWRASRDALERASQKYQARLSSLDTEGCSRLRRDILRTKDRDDLGWLLGWLGRSGNCDPLVYAELTRTPSAKARLAEFGLVRRMPPRRKRRHRKRRTKERGS